MGFGWEVRVVLMVVDETEMGAVEDDRSGSYLMIMTIGGLVCLAKLT